MIWAIVLFAALIVLLVLVGERTRQGGAAEPAPYTRQAALFSPAERSFLGVLEHAVDGDYRVFGKVRVADVVGVASGLERSAWQRAFNRISAKHFDFVLCAKDDLNVLAVVELDDRSHRRRKRQERDAFLAELCNRIGLPLVQLPARHAYSIPDVRARIRAALSADAGAPREAPPAAAAEAKRIAPVIAVAEAPASEQAAPVPVEDPPSCPKCAAPMARRQGQGGSHAGKEFWGCSAFPDCMVLLPIA